MLRRDLVLLVADLGLLARLAAALTLKLPTACATAPISSLRLMPGSSTSKLPSASSCMARLRRCIGLPIRKIESTVVTNISTAATAPIRSEVCSADADCSAAASTSLLHRLFSPLDDGVAPVSSSAASGAIMVEAICRASAVSLPALACTSSVTVSPDASTAAISSSSVLMVAILPAAAW